MHKVGGEEEQRGGGRIDEGLRIYTFLARLPFPNSYRGKFLLAAFVGLHVPLLALTFYVVLDSRASLGATLPLLVVVVLATLTGTAATLYVLSALLAPVSLSSRALREYVERGTAPDLPTHLTDLAGKLMADLQHTVDHAQHLERTVRLLEELSALDYLTSVYNRRAGEKRLEEDIARLRRGEGELTLAVLDVDRFKLVNDRYGHQAGDVCLKHVADTLERNIRRGDWISRWGGDEFIVALWNTGGDNSSPVSVLERVVADLEENPARIAQGEEIPLTLSGGVHRCTGEEDAQACFATADRALYFAKRAGRGKIVYGE